MATLSENHRWTREANLANHENSRGLREALEERDRDLRAIPATARIYDAFEARIAEDRARQLATEFAE